MEEAIFPGLQVLCEGSESPGGEIDIVIVNGLNSHLRQPWTIDGSEQTRSMWLEELLPQNMPNARIMLFGYNCHSTGENNLLSAEGLTHAAETLLASLDSNRAGARYHNRPLTFIAHDLGGAVVKKALVIASRKKGLSSTASNAHRLFFFGTPHRAKDLVSWDEVVLNIIFATHSSPIVMYNLPSRVRIFSKVLAQLAIDFNSIVTRKRVVNIYQRDCDSSVEGGSVEQVVNYYSATTDLVYETNIGRKSRHQDLGRFSKTDPEFIVILEALKTESDQHYVKCLSTLLTIAPSFPIPAEVRCGLGEMQKHKKVEAWSESENSSIIYFHGHQAMDRSMFSGTLFRSLQRLKSGHGRVAYYSFSGEDERRTTSTSLLSSLIYQILSQDPARFWLVRDLLVAIDKQSSWTSQTLWIFFRSLLATFGSETFYCVINEIHYCDSSWVQLLENLSALKANGNMHTRFKISFIGQERQDIKTFVNAIPEIRLDGHVFFTELLHSQRTQKIAELIAERPYLLVFRKKIEDALDKCESLLQLSLNVHILKDGSHELLLNRRSIDSEVQELPCKVSSLVSKTFQTLPEWARKALGWILRAQRPMKVVELAAAIALTDKEPIEVNENDRLLGLPTDLKSAFGPLIKVENNEAHFSHVQVKHYFQQAVKDEQETKELGADQDMQLQNKNKQKIPLISDWDITCILLKYLRSEKFLFATKKALQKDTWEKPHGLIFDLMEYAVEFWPAHYRKARHGSHVKEMVDLLQHRDMLQVWSELDSRIRSTLSPLDMYVMNPFYLGALLGFADIIDFYPRKTKQETGKSVTLEARSLAFYLASWAGHLEVVTTLVDNEMGDASANVSLALRSASSRGHEEVVELLMKNFPTATRNLVRHPAHLCRAAELGYQALVSMFITAGADVNATHEGRTPLQLAAKNGHESIVYNLLSQKADPNSASAKDSSKAIQLASSKGYTAVIQHLLKFHADVCVTDDDERTTLHLASRNGHQRIVKLLLEQNPHVEAQDNKGQTALHLASLNGHTEIVKLLTQGKRDPKIDMQDTLGNTPLNLASKNGHLPIVEFLLSKGVRMDMTDNEEETGHTALYYATSKGHEAIAERVLQATTEETPIKDVTEILLHAAKQGFILVCKWCIRGIPGTDLDLRGNNDYTALHYAAECGHVDIVSFLISSGASVDLETNRIGSPLALAASAGRGQVVRVLLTADANAMARIDDRTLVSHVAWTSGNTDGHADAVQALLKAGVGPDDVDEDGCSALHHAAMNGKLKIARILLGRGANPNIQDTCSQTPLHLAASQNHKEVVRLFIDQGVDLFVGRYDGATSMHVAAMWGCVAVMDVLWEAAPDLLICRSNDRRTPLHFAYDEIGSTKWLLAHSIDVNATTNAGKTAVMMSVESGHDKIVELLLSHNANVRLRDKSKQTALHYAAKGGHKKIAQHILEKDIKIINDQDVDGYSALHTAIYNREPNFVKMLLEERPDIKINLQDERGNTPLLLAVEAGLDDVVEHLLIRGAESDIRNRKGETALLLAIKDKAGSTRKTLLQSSDPVNINWGGGAFPTALHMAAWNGELEVVQQLLKHGADINAQGGLYNTALQAAAAGGFEDVVDYLLEKGADASLGGGLFANALSAAVASGTFNIVPILHENKADVNAQDGQGRTAIHLAAWRGSLDIFLWLKHSNGVLSIKDYQGRTALHHAAMAESLDVMKMLMQVEMWESLNVEDIDGWTPLHWACRSNHIKEMITLLNGEEDFFRREAKYGWTPEKIVIFHCTRDLVPLPALAVREPAGDEVPDKLEEEHPRQPTQQLRQKTWESGSSHGQYSCGGCQQFPIYGRRWHCTECEDFDFCFKCSWSREATHPTHQFEEKGEGPKTEPEFETDSD